MIDLRPLGENVTGHTMSWPSEGQHDDGRWCAWHSRLGKWVTIDADKQYTLECAREHRR